MFLCCSSSSSSSSGSGSSSGSDDDDEVPKKVEPSKSVKSDLDPLVSVEAKKAETKACPAPKPGSEAAKKKKKEKSETEDSSEDSSSESESESSNSSSEDDKPKKAPRPVATKRPETSNLDLLLSLEESLPTTASPQNVLTPTMGGMLTPMTSQPLPGSDSPISEAAAMFVPTKTVELLNKMTSGGLQVLFRFTRSPHLYSPGMCNIQVSKRIIHLKMKALTFQCLKFIPH